MARRLDYLDSARGLAALSVLFSHFMAAYARSEWSESLWYKSPLHAGWDGLAAVSFFFVLSGFVLSVRHFDARGKAVLAGFSLSGFATVRVLRIAGPYLILVVLSFLAWKYAFGNYTTIPKAQDWIKYSWRDTLSWPLLRSNLNLLALGREYQIVPQAWTLSYEMVLSLGIPFAVLIAGYSTRWFAFAVLFALLLLDVNRYLLQFALGVGLAKAYAMDFRITDKRVKIVALLTGLLLYSSRFSVFKHFPFPVGGPPIWTSTAFGSLLLLWTILSSRRLQDVLAHPKLIFLGKISFQVYLCHFLVLMRVTPLFLVFLNRYVTTSWHVCFFSALAFTTAVTVFFSWLLYSGVERPLVRLAKRLGQLLGGGARQRVPTPADAVDRPAESQDRELPRNNATA